MKAFTLNLPKIGSTVAGGTYAGVMTGKDGAAYALVTIDARPGTSDGFLTWPQAMEWATSVGGDLPTRAEAEVLRATLRDQLPEESWTCDARDDDAGMAWIALFLEDDQTSTDKDAPAEAMAIRRVPLVDVLSQPAPVEPCDRSEVLAGAEACRLMLAGIGALGTVSDDPGLQLLDDEDDGCRHDYLGGDRLVAQALDLHGANPGFRQALSVYLLAVADESVPVPEKETAMSLLTDGGYRGRHLPGALRANATPRRTAKAVPRKRSLTSQPKSSDLVTHVG